MTHVVTTIKRPDVKLPMLQTMKVEKKPAVLVSVYTWDFSTMFAEAGVDIFIIGDSCGNNILGYKNTLPVTMDHMIMLSSAVCRGAGPVFTVGDMPLGSYQASDQEAVQNANRFLKEAGCCAVKCEASMKLLPRFEAIANAEIPVMGHIGLNPQKIHEMGGYRIQGKTIESTVALMQTAKALEDAGAFALLLEGVTEEVAGLIRDELKIPVYGIGSGRAVDGQLIVGPDLWNRLAWRGRPLAKYIPEIKIRKTDCLIEEAMRDVFERYVEGVRNGTLITENHVHHIDVEEFEKEGNGQYSEILAKLQKQREFMVQSA